MINNADRNWVNCAGRLHRVDGPAVIRPDGTKIWFCDGRLHREDGPAIINPTVGLSWWLNDQLHRLDGPAIEYVNGRRQWWLNGKQYPFDKWSNVALISSCKLVELMLKYTITREDYD